MKVQAILIAFLIFWTLPPVAAQDTLAGRPWAVALSLVASFMAVVCSATAVIVMGIYPKSFWMLHGLSAVLFIIAFSLSDPGSIPFIVGTLCLAAVILVLIAVGLSKRAVAALVKKRF
ncbi:MAG: hypothetical protein ACK4GQ_02410 [Candidatus Hadarchaeales archaeon]